MCLSSCPAVCPAQTVIKAGTADTCVECNSAPDCAAAGFTSLVNVTCSPGNNTCGCEAGYHATLTQNGTARQCDVDCPAGMVPASSGPNACVFACDQVSDCAAAFPGGLAHAQCASDGTCGCAAPYVVKDGPSSRKCAECNQVSWPPAGIVCLCAAACWRLQVTCSFTDLFGS